MSRELESQLLLFIQSELGAEGYIDPAAHFSEFGIESFQVLEILMEIERQLGKKLSIKALSGDSLLSLRALLGSSIIANC